MAMIPSIHSVVRSASTFVFVVLLTCLAGQAQELGQRVISQAPVEAGRRSPVEVVSVKIKGGEIEPGRPFLAGDDWLLGLTLRVRSVSGRPISLVDVSLRFPAAADRGSKSV